MKFARWSFLISGVYGILVLIPQYFMESRIGEDFPPPITHPEQFYGFIGVALAFQVLFLIIATDPVRYRPAMIPSILEKLAFFIPAVILFSKGRIAPMILGVAGIDFIISIFFAVSYFKTQSQ